MSASTLAFALTACLASQVSPQLVVVPLQAEGVAPQVAIDAWKTILLELTKAQTRIKFSLKLQRAKHDLILGPVREQARDCKGRLDCLKELGTTLGANELVVGRVAPEEVSLVAISVRTGRELGTIRSPSWMKNKSPEARAKSAAQSLLAALKRNRIRQGLLPPDAPSDAASPSDVEGVTNALTASEPRAVSREGALDAETTVEMSDSLDRSIERLSAAEPVPTEGGPFGANVGVGAMPSTPPSGRGDVRTAVELEGVRSSSRTPSLDAVEALHLATVSVARASLAEIVALEMDGVPLVDDGETAPSWRGGPGAHRLRARRADGSEAELDFTVEPGTTTELSVPPRAPVSAGTDHSALAKESRERSPWWFWVALVGAVLAGSATAVVLSGGVKGGPSVQPADPSSPTELRRP